jgi:molecular chaperone DnaJ
MKEKGVPHLRGSTVGSQFVRVVVHTPENLNAKQKSALKVFADKVGDKIAPKKGFFERVKERFV